MWRGGEKEREGKKEIEGERERLLKHPRQSGLGQEEASSWVFLVGLPSNSVSHIRFLPQRAGTLNREQPSQVGP